jgi:hypothetical protein
MYLPFLSSLAMTLTSEGHPAVQRCGTPLAPTARFNSDAVGCFLDEIPKTYLVSGLFSQ